MFLYLPKLLTGVHDLTKADAGARAAGFALVAVVGRPLGGALADRVGAVYATASASARTATATPASCSSSAPPASSAGSSPPLVMGIVKSATGG